jgi:predicted nucleic acid-binding Zn ribbon protein
MSKPRKKASVDGPTDISILLERVFQSQVLASHLEDAILVTRWPEVVGETVASHVKLIDFRDGVLMLRCESSAWRSEVNWSKKAILDRSNALLGKLLAKDLRFV